MASKLNLLCSNLSPLCLVLHSINKQNTISHSQQMFHTLEFLLPPLSLLFCTTLFWQIFFHRVCQVNIQHSNLHVLFKHKVLQVLCGVEKCCVPCISKHQLSSMMCYNIPSSHVSTPPTAMTLWNPCASPTLSWNLPLTTHLASKKLFILLN